MNLRELNTFGFPDWDEFEVAIATAAHNAKTDWEVGFVEDIAKRYISYGKEIYLTRKSACKLFELQKAYGVRK